MRIDPYDLPYLGSRPLPFEIVTAILKYNLAYDTPSFAYRTFNEDDEEEMEMDSTRGNLLSKTSLISSTWRLASQSLLFSSVVIMSAAELDSLLAAVTGSEELANTVRVLRVTHTEVFGVPSKWRAWKLAALMRKCVNLRELYCRDITLQMADLAIPQNLRHLSLHECQFLPLNLVHRNFILPRLVSLNLHVDRRDPFQDDASTMLHFFQPWTLPRLKYLAAKNMEAIGAVLTLLTSLDEDSVAPCHGLEFYLRSIAFDFDLPMMITPYNINPALSKLLHLQVRFEEILEDYQFSQLPQSIISLTVGLNLDEDGEDEQDSDDEDFMEQRERQLFFVDSLHLQLKRASDFFRHPPPPSNLPLALELERFRLAPLFPKLKEVTLVMNGTYFQDLDEAIMRFKTFGSTIDITVITKISCIREKLDSELRSEQVEFFKTSRCKRERELSKKVA